MSHADREGDTGAMAARLAGWLPAIVLLAVAAAYTPSLFGEWIWDDVAQYRDNPAITKPWVLVTNDIWGPTGQARTGNLPVYRPLAMLTHVPGQALIGGPFPERVLNLALFLGLVGGVARLGRALGASPPAAWFGAAVLGAHPAATESVAWISCRGELLGAGLVLAGILAFATHRERTAGLYLALAPFCKETFLLTPLVLGVWMVAQRRFSAWATSGAIAGVIAYLGIRRGLDIPMGSSGVLQDPWGLVGAIGAVAGRGVALLLDPTAPDAVPAFEAAPAIGLGVLALGVVALAFLPGRAWLAALYAPLPLVALAAPASMANGIVSDRYFLVAWIGVATAAACGYAALESRSKPGARLAPALALIPLCWLPFTTLRAGDWIDTERLFTATLARDPDNPVALFSLGYRRHTHFGDCEAALPYYVAAMSRSTRAGNNYQACLLELGRVPEAARIGPQLASADSDNPVPALNTARAHLRLGRLDQAEHWAREGLRRQSENTSGITLLGTIAGLRGEHARARAFFERALVLDPGDAQARAGFETARRLAQAAS